MSKSKLESSAASHDTKKAPKKGAFASFFAFENLRSLFILIVIIFAVRWSVISPYHVPTASMEPTIKVGDRLLAYKLAYNFKFPFSDYVIAEWSKPQRGDIIVFRYPKDPEIDYVKRVIGIAGDKIQIIDDIILINGEPQERIDHNFDRHILEDIEDNKDIKLLYKEKLGQTIHWVMQNEPAARTRMFNRSHWPSESNDVYTVPPDSVFVIGDNRDNSTDSRVWFEVPMSYIRGKALFVIWSVFTPSDTNWPKIRFDRFGYWLT